MNLQKLGNVIIDIELSNETQGQLGLPNDWSQD